MGKRLEVLWRYTNGETGDAMLIWRSGTVRRVADDLSDKRSARARSSAGGSGAVGVGCRPRLS